ncbi:MAG: PLP-dependent aminotransferase family protein [Oscillochloridaceae bacterium umkhey_bin13]
MSLSQLPNQQLFVRPGISELGWGHPDPALLPVAAIQAAAQTALVDYGQLALAYGAEQGPGRLIAALQERMFRLEGTAPPATSLMISGGISHALDMLCAHLSQPGDVVLVEAPTYHLALRIFRDRGLQFVAVPGDAEGMQVEAAAAQLTALHATGRRVAFIYVVSSFGNPSGAVLSATRRAALGALAQAAQIPVIEDEAYAELWYNAPPPPAIGRFRPGAPVIRVGSFAKILAPGLRLGWIQADPALIQRCTAAGVLDSGGGVNHLTTHLLASLIEQGALDQHVAQVRAAWQTRRDALLDGLASALPSSCHWHTPQGGYFVWVRLPPGTNTTALLPHAEAAGVSYLPGERFFAAGGGQAWLRLSFSLLPADALRNAAQRLGQVVQRQC